MIYLTQEACIMGLLFKSKNYIEISMKHCKLTLPRVLQQDLEQYVLHPSLLDGALQSVFGLFSLESDKQIFLPFSMGEITIFKSLPATCYVHVETQTSETENTLLKFQLKIADTSGNICVLINDFVVRAFK